MSLRQNTEEKLRGKEVKEVWHDVNEWNAEDYIWANQQYSTNHHNQTLDTQLGGLEHLKIETRLKDERFASVMGECVI